MEFLELELYAAELASNIPLIALPLLPRELIR